MKPPSTKFAVAICGVVALLSLWSVKDFYQQSGRRIASGDPYGVFQQQARLRGVLPSLPAVTVFGYMNEPGADSFSSETKMLGALYAFAPRMLVRQNESPQQWVIGDFSQPINLTLFAGRNGLEVVKDFGGGIVLFQRISHP